MKWLKLQTYCILLAITIPVFMVIHWILWTKKEVTIDKLEMALIDIKKIIPQNSKISFITNLKEPSPVTELYFQTEFIMCPVIVTQDIGYDTILLVEKAGEHPIKIEKTDTIYMASKDDIHIMLLKRK